ncbi:18285_t:CDS:2, partial [Racocetra persica]
YPSTSPEGVATIFHVADWADPNHAWKNSPYFGNVQVNKEERDCLGIKVCQFTDPSLTSIEHNEVDIESSLWKRITKNQNVDFKKTHTYITYLAAKDAPCKFKYNNGSFIGCSMYRIGDQWHRYTKVDSEKVDIVLLRDLFLGKEE